MLRTFKHLGHLEAQRALTLAVLVAFCATLMPLPMISSARLEKSTGEAFPCQDSPCGCRTAHQCWTSCCCTTPAQRLAWAKSRGVTPPAYAHRALQMLAAVAAKQVASAPKTKACCAKTSACCSEKTTPAQQPAAAAKPKQRGFVIGALALQCQGKASAYSALPWAVIQRPAGLPAYVLPIEFGWQLHDVRPIAVAQVPPLPPPRAFLPL